MAALTTDDAPAPHLLGVAKGGAKDRVLGGGASKMPGLPASMGGAECSLDGAAVREGNTALQTEDGLREAEEGLAVFRGTAEVADGDVVAIYQVERGMYWTCEEQTIGGGYAIKLRPRGRQLSEGNKFSVVIAPDDTDHLGNEKGVRFALRSHYNNKLVAPNFRGRCVAARSFASPCARACYGVQQHCTMSITCAIAALRAFVPLRATHSLASSRPPFSFV